MNKVILMGRLTRDPDVRYTASEKPMAVARFTLAVDRKYSKEEENSADFISCIAFDRKGEFAEKYLRKAIKVVVTGRISTGSYTNKEGQKIYTTDVIVEDIEFAESKSKGDSQNSEMSSESSDGFMNIPDGLDEELPFN